MTFKLLSLNLIYARLEQGFGVSGKILLCPSKGFLLLDIILDTILDIVLDTMFDILDIILDTVFDILDTILDILGFALDIVLDIKILLPLDSR
jgi:hypothetical protein